MEKVEVICVGTELLFDRINRNVNFISNSLAKIGLSISRSITVPDEKEEIKESLEESFSRADIIFLTGGLGPTFDDITREAVSEFLGRKLVFSEKIWEEIREKFIRRGIEPPEINKRQSYIIEGAKILKNEVGTAPGMILEEKGKIIILLPGPPSELIPMMEKDVTEYLKKKIKTGKIEIYRFCFIGVPESVVEEKSKEIISSYGTEFSIIPHSLIIEMIARLYKPEDVEKIWKLEKEFEKIFGKDFIGVNPPPLPQLVGILLKERRLKLALAESCTGGLVGKMITDIPGSSEYFQGCFVTYSNILKKRILRVPRTVLKKYGAVSEECAILMAKGARKYGKADIGLSITGIAGPTGGSEEKPVGLVWMALAFPKGKVFTKKNLFTGTREQIREKAAITSLDFLRRKLTEENG